MADVEDADLAVELARSVLARVAPEELPLFAVTSELYRADPAAVEAQAGREEVLGFGADAITALTPIVLSVAGSVATFLLQQVRAVAAEESEGVVRGMVRRLLRPFAGAGGGGDDDDAPAPPALSVEQLRAVRDVAFERARRLSLPDDQASLLADAMVGGLVTA